MVSYADSTDGPPEVDLDGLASLISFEGTNVCDGKNVIPFLRELVATVKSVVNEFDDKFVSH
jgi:hypothetical protein